MLPKTIELSECIVVLVAACIPFTIIALYALLGTY
jgi:hypothetical protein